MDTYPHLRRLMCPLDLLLTQGTLVVEWPIATGVSGVVTRETKGSTQGMITVMDGNLLELPVALKFPKVRRAPCQARS